MLSYENIKTLLNGRQKVFNNFESQIFLIRKQIKNKNKKRTLKQILQRLSIVLAKVKSGDKTEILLNEICQIIYSFYRGNY